MALIHMAELRPTKIELLQDWVPGQRWLGDVDPAGLTVLGGYRFDDPAGEVGIETLLLGTDSGAILQVPLTYRGAPLADADPIATTQHSVLGQRWVYDGLVDPAYLQSLVTVILIGAEQAELFRVRDGQRQTLPPTARVRGTGQPGAPVPSIQPGPVRVEEGSRLAEAGPVIVTVRHLVDAEVAPGDCSNLIGTWEGQSAGWWLAAVRPIQSR